MRAKERNTGAGGIKRAARRRFVVAMALASAAALPMAASAQAEIVTVGSPLTGAPSSATIGNAATLLNPTLAAGKATSPVDGAIVRWRVQGATGGPFRLRVMTPVSGTTYTGGGSTGPETPAATTVQTFSASLPIKAGQAIGLDNTNGADKIGVLAAAGSSYTFWVPPLAPGATLPGSGPFNGAELTFNADVQPVPKVAAVSPTSGPAQGGTSVTILGTDFTDVKAVSFGSTPAQSFTVGSEAQITAVAPAAAGPGPVNVSVTTVAGQSAATPTTQYTYTACVVPKLKQKKIKGVRKALRKNGCVLGKVQRKDKAGKNAKVTKQSSKPGTVLAPGAKVNITLRD